MNQSNFYNFQSLLKTKNYNMKKKNTLGEKFVFQEVKWLRYIKEEKNTVFYKTSLKDDAVFKRLDFSCTKTSKTMNDIIYQLLIMILC